MSALPPVVVLAGGQGTRLGEHAEGMPKPVVDVAGTPFLVLVLRLLASQGVREAVVCTGHGARAVRAAVDAHPVPGLAVRYLDDGPVPLGTGGALAAAAATIAGPFLVVNGDSYLPCDLRGAWTAFGRSGQPALMVVHHNQGQWDRSNVRFEHGQVVAYDKWEPDPDMAWIDYGLAVMTPEALADVPAGRPDDLGRVFQRLIARHALAGHAVAERFYEVGSPRGLAELRAAIAAGEVVVP